MPVLQGYTADEYLRHIDRYGGAGVNLLHERLVGLGFVCHRQDTREAEEIICALYRIGIRLHVFGFTSGGIKRASHHLASAENVAAKKLKVIIKVCC